MRGATWVFSAVPVAVVFLMVLLSKLLIFGEGWSCRLLPVSTIVVCSVELVGWVDPMQVLPSWE